MAKALGESSGKDIFWVMYIIRVGTNRSFKGDTTMKVDFEIAMSDISMFRS